MALTEYRKKRTLRRTPEPAGGKAARGKLLFVVQQHAATSLHYDFRLEMKGVLKSWAIPKGPSLDPGDKRLAMQVEDHPYDYRNFEGIIPEGNYGAGVVIVWDTGTYEPLVRRAPHGEEAADKASQEKILLRDLHAGSLKIVLKGKKLKGEFALVKMRGRSKNAWLLIKHSDRYAGKTDVTQKDKSVISRKTIVQLANAAGVERSSVKKASRKRTISKTHR